MSSDMKDARWGMAMCMADQNDLDWYKLSYEDQTVFLRMAQSELDRYPGEIPFWAEEFRGE